MWSIQFWKDVAERALKSAAQAFLLVVGGDVFNVWAADWPTIGGVTLSGAALSVATSLVSGAISASPLPIGSPGTASLTAAVEPAVEITKHGGDLT